MHCTERFDVLLYDRISPYSEVNEARKELFAKINFIQRTPPTYDAFKLHVKKSVFQGDNIWGQAVFTKPAILSLTS